MLPPAAGRTADLSILYSKFNYLFKCKVIRLYNLSVKRRIGKNRLYSAMRIVAVPFGVQPGRGA
jgi:hypothetical protein